VSPDYTGGGIVNLVASIAARFGHRTGYRSLGGLPPLKLQHYKKIVLVVVDGLGWEFLQGQGDGGFLRGLVSGRMTSVFPSTTASAVATFATGTAPVEHGVTGWFTHLRELGTVAKILFSRPRHGGAAYPENGVPMSQLVRAPSLFGRLKAGCFLVTPAEIANSEFNRAISAGATPLGYRSLEGFCLNIGRALESGHGPIYVSAYWPRLDELAHRHGCQSRQVWEHFMEIDAALHRLCGRYAGDGTIFLITADHGLADTPPRRCIDLGSHPKLSQCLVLPLCGEPRLAYCYVHPDRAAFFRMYVRSQLGHACRMFDRRHLIEAGYFGPKRPKPWFHHRVGDYILAMKDGWTMRDFLPNEEGLMLAAGHGGMTAAEMLVPLIVAG